MNGYKSSIQKKRARGNHVFIIRNRRLGDRHLVLRVPSPPVLSS